VFFLLGTYNTISVDENTRKAVTVFYNGEACLPYRSNRESRVEFVCAQKITFVSVTEPSTCTYVIVVGVPEVCGHSWFGSPSIGMASEQPWVLKLQENLDNFECIVQHSGYGPKDPFYFESFKLQFDEKSLISFEARHPHRQHFSEEEINELNNGIETTENFQHSLSFASIETSKN